MWQLGDDADNHDDDDDDDDDDDEHAAILMNSSKHTVILDDTFSGHVSLPQISFRASTLITLWFAILHKKSGLNVSRLSLCCC